MFDLFLRYLFELSGPPLLLTGAWLLVGVLLPSKPARIPKKRWWFLGPFLVVASPWALFIAAAVIGGGFVLVQYLLRPVSFWFLFGIIGCVWLYYRRAASRVHKAIAKTLKPWFIGMLVVGCTFLIAKFCVPRSSWPVAL
ncbi:MAG: hypothetical protein WDO56_09580 [Gammaproteobacteria bacterium]